MKILCCCYRASLLTGSELYFFELCSALSNLGHDVTLSSGDISPFFKEMCEGKFKLVHLSEIRKNNTFYDIILLSHYRETFQYIMHLNTPIINIVHSEIYDSEIPLIHPLVKKYVGVRESICEKIKNHGIEDHKIEMIRNPIDLSRFNTRDTSNDGIGLFVGTMGGVRHKAALHFADFCKYNNLKSVYVSAENQYVPYYDICLPKQESIEKLFKRCSISGGVLKGRTYFEARLCGKATIEYFINNIGEITNIDYEEEPSHSELQSMMKEFDKFEVAKRILI